MLTLVGKNYVYVDQDILNRLCEGKVGFLDMRWNVMMDCGDRRREDISRFAPRVHAEAYQQSREDPWIIHFAGEPKPWQKDHVDYEAVFWEYAKGCGEAPMLQSNMRNSTGPGQEQYYTAAHRFINKLSTNTVLYRFFTDVLCPRGSLRFEYLKKVYHKTLMRKRYRQNGW
jgi:lipopolysaccharide biosynthesis glycosyltransferase